MTHNMQIDYLKPKDVIRLYGTCLELVPTDPNFHDMSVGLYVKEQLFTIWTFSRKPGVSDRIEEIRNQLVKLGAVSYTHLRAHEP